MMRKLGKYEILEEEPIGRGKFAQVYKARDTESDKIVALKVLRLQSVDEFVSVQRFQQEARNARKLEHDHIVRVYKVDEDQGQHYIAMELAQGPTLAELIREQGPMSWEDALEILEQIASALDYAHDHKLVHRDIKPSNVLLDSEKGVLLSDFGLSKAIEKSGDSLTATGSVLGTVNYIAPEIWNGERAEPASDVYALGCVLYEMVTGQVLFDADSPLNVMRLHESGPKPDDIAKVEKRYRKAFRKALEKSPDKRYQRAGEFVATLRAEIERTKTAVHHRVWALLGLLVFDLCQVIFWGWCLFGNHPDLMAYLQTVGTCIGLPLAVVLAFFVIRRPIVWEDALHHLGTDQNWTYFTLVLTILFIITTLLFWPLKWVDGCRNQPTPAFTSTSAPTATLTNTPTLTATATSTHTPRVVATRTATSLPPVPAITLSHTPTLTQIPMSAPTEVPLATPPRLIAPAKGALSLPNPISFQWSGTLYLGQAYRVTAYLREDKPIQSELLTDESWTPVYLLNDQAGEWRWRVSVVVDGREVATSPEWTFWFQPFPDGERPTQTSLTSTPPTATPPPSTATSPP
jgi:serine/threonine-protein kinase